MTELTPWRRRELLSILPAAAGVHLLRSQLRANDRMPLRNPRAIAGDIVEPDWDSKLQVTVGTREGDLVGSSEKVIQAAVDYMAAAGGGTVKVLPGTFRFRNAVMLRNGVRILGSGPDSVFIKAAEVKTNLSESSDFWEQEITVENASGLQVGDGVCLRTDDVWHRGRFVTRRTLVAQKGNRFKLDRPLIEDNFTLRGKAHLMTLFPLLCGENVSDVVIENLTIDGNKKEQENLPHFWGNYIAGVWLMRVNRLQMRKLILRNSASDGASWQMSHDVVVEDCHSHDNVCFGLHPGSGSQRPLVRRNKLERNYIGFYFCYGVKYGLVEKNVMLDNQTSGVSIGQKDTDNLIRDNEIRGNKEVGVLFRALEPVEAPHRNRVENNRILDSGSESGVGVDVQGKVEEVTIAGNEIRETRQPGKRIGVRIGANSRNVTVENNRIEGFAVKVSDLRKPSA